MDLSFTLVVAFFWQQYFPLYSFFLTRFKLPSLQSRPSRKEIWGLKGDKGLTQCDKSLEALLSYHHLQHRWSPYRTLSLSDSESDSSQNQKRKDRRQERPQKSSCDRERRYGNRVVKRSFTKKVKVVSLWHNRSQKFSTENQYGSEYYRKCGVNSIIIFCKTHQTHIVLKSLEGF